MKNRRIGQFVGELANRAKLADLLQPIGQFPILVNRATLHVPIGQCLRHWSNSTILTNFTKTNAWFAQWDLVIICLVFCLHIETPTYI